MNIGVGIVPLLYLRVPLLYVFPRTTVVECHVIIMTIANYDRNIKRSLILIPVRL
jgi:hypothetical protein